LFFWILLEIGYLDFGFKNIIMKKILFIFAFLIFLPLTVGAQQKISATYFYADWCPHCQNVNKYFLDNGVYEKFDITKLNFDEPANKIKLKDMLAVANYTGSSGIPAIFIDGKVLTGDKDIIAYFKEKLPAPLINKPQEPKKQSNLPNNLTIFALLAAAFVDASNPCALAVLILLIATVMGSKGKHQALLAGLAFSLAVFTSYFLMGLGIYRAIAIFGVSKYFSIGVGVLAILIALANFKDFFWYGKIFIMEVPLSWRPKMQSIIRKVASPFGALGAGFVVSLFLVPCSSGPYVVILGMLAERVEMGKTIGLLALYNFVFVLPMLLITFGMYFFNTKMGKLESWRKSHLKILHLIAGAIMFVIGAYLIYSRW
jgi:cytochrome c biogenesis protein CcdA/glutaredoxin